MLSRATRQVATSSRFLHPLTRRELFTAYPVLQRQSASRRELSSTTRDSEEQQSLTFTFVAAARNEIPYRRRSRPPSKFSPEYAEAQHGGEIDLQPGNIVPSRPVTIPPDSDGVLQSSHAAREVLAHDTLVIVR